MTANAEYLIAIPSISPMDFAQPVSFKNADIGRCAHQKPREDEDAAVPAEAVTQPGPVPTPALPAPTPVGAHVSVSILALSRWNLSFQLFSERK